jgi:hypothetical protein
LAANPSPATVEKPDVLAKSVQSHQILKKRTPHSTLPCLTIAPVLMALTQHSRKRRVALAENSAS